MSIINFIVLAGVLSLWHTVPVFAQDFSLFEPIETTDAPEQARIRQERGSTIMTTEPEFTVEGTSRIGDKLSVMLNHRSGEKIVIAINPQGDTPIPDYEEYSILNSGAGRVSIQYPGSSPCMEYQDRGVRCSEAANVASLELVTGKAIQSTEPVLSQSAAQADAGTEITGVANNPFEMMRARQAEQAGQDIPALQEGRVDFTPRRIDPNDVPPGMRVVSTPFGDRLVEQ